MSRPLRAVLTDDEPSGRASVRSLIARDPLVEIVAECVTGPETVRAVAELQPDLLFLDVQLPGRSGVEALEEIPADAMPVVVFVTAYDQYALRAFDAHAADYLLKPYTDARFHLALERAKQRLEQRSLERIRQGLLTLAEQAKAGPVDAPSSAPSDNPRGSRRLVVRTPGGLRIVRVDEIGWVEAAGDYVCLHADEQVLLARFTMGTLERWLDPSTFVRIHRSTIVNVNFVRELRGSPSSDYVAVLRDGRTRPISGRGRDQLARALNVRL